MNREVRLQSRDEETTNGSVAGVLFDFHVHTPVSRCYSDRDIQPKEIVETADSLGIDAIVVNDHHSPAALDDIRAAAQETSLTVFPALEITTSHGHIVTAFDPDTENGTLLDLLRDLDVPAREHGNGHYAVNPPMSAVIEATVAAGGLPIPAHVDRWPNGFVEAQMERRTRFEIHAHPGIDVLEITRPHTQEQWQRGAVHGFPRPLACIQGSDAHALAEIGRRSTRVATDELTVAGLRRAFRRIDGATELMQWR